jgi:hypothetical protein
LGGRIVIALSADGQLLALLDEARMNRDAWAGSLMLRFRAWFWGLLIASFGRALQNIG